MRCCCFDNRRASYNIQRREERMLNKLVVLAARLRCGDGEKKAIIALRVEKCGFRIPFRLKPDFIPRRGKSAKGGQEN
jgi:hypothetical protein